MSPVSANTDLMAVGVINAAETPASSRALSGSSSIAQCEVRECGGIEPLRGDKALNRCEDIFGQISSLFIACRHLRLCLSQQETIETSDEILMLLLW